MEDQGECSCNPCFSLSILTDRLSTFLPIVCRILNQSLSMSLGDPRSNFSFHVYESNLSKVFRTFSLTPSLFMNFLSPKPPIISSQHLIFLFQKKFFSILFESCLTMKNLKPFLLFYSLFLYEVHTSPFLYLSHAMKILSPLLHLFIISSDHF